MRVIVGELDQLEVLSKRAGGIALPLTTESKDLSSYGIYCQIPERPSYQADLGRSISRQLANSLPLIVARVYPDSYPAGPWALLGKVCHDKRFMIAHHHVRWGVKELDIGAPLKLSLPEMVAKHISPIRLGITFGSRYNELEKYAKPCDDGLGRYLEQDAALFEALAYPSNKLPGLPASFGDIEPWHIENPEYIEYWISQYRRFGMESKWKRPSDFLKSFDATGNSLLWKNGTSTIDKAMKSYFSNDKKIKLFWYDTVIAKADGLAKKTLIKVTDNFLGRLIEKHNGLGVIHPLIDNFLTERSATLKSELIRSIDESASGRIVAENFGHIRVVKANESGVFSSTFRETVLNESVVSMSNESGIIESGIVLDMNNIESILSESMVKDDVHDVYLPKVKHVNISGCQPKFGGTIRNVNNIPTLIPSVNGSPFTHVIKPPGSKSGGELLPVAEWIGLRAAKAAGLPVAECALFCHKQIEINNHEQSGDFGRDLDDAFGLFDNEVAKAKSKAELRSNAWNDGLKTFFVSERFDIKNASEQKKTRTVALDLCQLMGCNIIDDSNVKYHSSIEELTNCLHEYFNEFGCWEQESNELFRQLVYSWLVGDGDLHLKNLSVIYSESLDDAGDIIDASLKMAPVYDRVIVAGLPGGYNTDMALPFMSKMALDLNDWLIYAEHVAGMPNHEAEAIIVKMRNDSLSQIYDDLYILLTHPHFMSNTYQHRVISEFCAATYVGVVDRMMTLGFNSDSFMEEHVSRANEIRKSGDFLALEKQKGLITEPVFASFGTIMGLNN